MSTIFYFWKIQRGSCFSQTKKNEKPVTFLKLKRLTFKLPLIIYK
jgi:hypothetical protein